MSLLNEFRFIRPETTAQAVTALAGSTDTRVLCGGTDLLPNLRRGLVSPGALVDVSRLESLQQISWEDDRLTLGAAITLEELANEPRLNRHFPALVKAILSVAGPSHRAAASLGGNLCQDTRCIFYNQSDWWRRSNDYCLKYRGELCHVMPKGDRCYATYHGDIAPVLMALGAQIDIIGPGGSRRLPLDGLYQENGSHHLSLEPGELVSTIILPRHVQWHSGYEKVRVRDAIDFPLAGVAAALRREGDTLAQLRLVVTGTNSIPIRVDLSQLEGGTWSDEAAEEMAKAIRKAVNVLKTTVTGPKYRRRVVMAMAKRLVSQLWQQAA
ncbi:4-hydroxybenzoyl-CoA reductase subunit beta [Sedimenticola selenatireducens]|uniref:4-hydroxybenzoyl-CoA reductase subunit beta n=1 Tax=Sedimenticola selenatireducens TaxID=191960 RepID=UPI000491CDFA|nr:4-hydroxybenzoyl-CoA reductase subunit beta [Sedimenticola selenatireducens]